MWCGVTTRGIPLLILAKGGDAFGEVGGNPPPPYPPSLRCKMGESPARPYCQVEDDGVEVLGRTGEEEDCADGMVVFVGTVVVAAPSKLVFSTTPPIIVFLNARTESTLCISFTLVLMFGLELSVEVMVLDIVFEDVVLLLLSFRLPAVVVGKDDDKVALTIIGGLSPSLDGSGIDKHGRSIDSFPPSTTPLKPSVKIPPPPPPPFILLLPRVTIPQLVITSCIEPLSTIFEGLLVLEGLERKGMVTMLVLLTPVPPRLIIMLLLWEVSPPMDAVDEVVVLVVVL
eukprot:GFYU01012056.1.p2 GENE.GFYU01012056.1~~GFYU01012056.1.p2  ORF type:complete len:285 (+),score=7.23 GFYU01012056.1:342-1196(+)